MNDSRQQRCCRPFLFRDVGGRADDGVCRYASRAGLRCQALQDLLTQLLRLAERFLVLDKDPVQLQRLVDGELVAQHHVAHVHGVRQGCVFGQFFKGGGWIVVVHAVDSTPAISISQPSFPALVVAEPLAGQPVAADRLVAASCNLRSKSFWWLTRRSTVSTVAARRSELLSSSRADFSK